MNLASKITLSSQQLDKLKRLIGEEKILTSVEEKTIYAYDASRIKSPPSVVVLPECLDDIVKVMQFADEENIPVYPRGAGSGLTGGAVPLLGGIALVFTKMNRILEVDEINQTVTVEPGVIVSDLKKTVARLNLFYPPDPSSAEFATIGGNLAECAGGLRCLKYGATRDYVLWLEVVRMGGEVLHFGSSALKSVTGYDMVRLLVGSEGTLAVFSKIKLRLIPKPETAQTVVATFADETQAMNTALRLLRSGLIPSALEFIDSLSLQCAYEFLRAEIISQAKAALFIEVDGSKAQVAENVEKAVQICKQTDAIKIHISSDESSAKKLWEIRHCLSPALYRLAPSKINEDIAVPRSELVEVFSKIKQLAKEQKLTVAIFGHCGDGNLHVNFMYDENNAEQKKQVEASIPDLFRLVIEHHGTLSGEHGVGITKAPYLSLEITPPVLKLQQQIKKLWDPKNLLNSGKIFIENF